MKISMEGKGRYTDIIFVGRLCRTLKYEELYLEANANATEARRNWAFTFGSTMTRDPIKPWDIVRQPRFSTMTLLCETMRQKGGGVLQTQCWNRRQERQDSHFIQPH